MAADGPVAAGEGRAPSFAGPAAAVPAAAWLLPEVGVGFPAEHRDGAEALRQAVALDLAALDGVELVVLLVDDPAAHVTLEPAVDLAPLGVVAPGSGPARPRLVAERREHLALLVAATVAADVDDAVVVGPQERVLRRLLAAAPATVGVPVLAVGVGCLAAGDGSLAAAAARLGALLDRLGKRVASPGRLGLVVPGDLTTSGDLGSPGYRVDGAREASLALAGALREGAPVTPVESASTDDARMPGRRPLGVLRGLLEARRRAPSSCHDDVVRGVHYVVAAWPGP